MSAIEIFVTSTRETYASQIIVNNIRNMNHTYVGTKLKILLPITSSILAKLHLDAKSTPNFAIELEYRMHESSSVLLKYIYLWQI